MTRLSLALLGPMRITLGERPVGGIAYNKARALLAYLAVERDYPHARDSLAALLWPELPDDAARHNLRQALANLREAIHDATAIPPFLLITRDTIQFNPVSEYELDVAAFTALLAACESHIHRHPERCASCAERMEQALSLYHSDFLAGFSVDDSAPFEEWQLRQRERLHQQALGALIRLADYYEGRGESERARQYAQRQVELEPWREEAHRQLMRLLAQSGQRSAAIAQYETCRRILARDLGVEPEAETAALYELIRDGASAEFQMLSSDLSVRRREIQNSKRRTQNLQNFPAQTTPLIGREAELEELGALLENPLCRLVTIIGPGGIGKTRLALAAAVQWADVFLHGAAFVSLQAIGSTALVASAILTALELPLQGQRDPRDQLLDYLRAKELLLILDNFEQLLAPNHAENGGAAALLADMLQRAPGVTLLVTSRERLSLHGEWLFDPPGLSYPLAYSADAFESYSAVQLFLQRARQVRRQFALAEGEARAVARICRLVEGLPLAIELAAAALRTRSCAAIAEAIERNLSALTIELRAVPARHRSMWATFEHSWRLLSDEERRVFSRLSVFRGGFQADAAAQVAQATLQILAALIDKSLLRWDGVKRYDLHELLRQNASEKLEQSNETEQTHGQHLAHYLALAEAAEPNLVQTHQMEWLDRLEVEHGNLRAALGWALEQGNSASALRLGGFIGKFWEVRGYWSEGRQWLEQALTLSLEVGSNKDSVFAAPGLSALALQQAGKLAWRQCDFAYARELLEQSLSLYREVQNQDALTEVLGILGGLAFEQGEYASARARYEEYLALGRTLGNAVLMSDALFCLGLVSYHQGGYAAAQTLLEESLKLARERGYELATSHPLNALGNLANLQGNYAAAQVFYEECLLLRRKLADKRGIAATLADVANLQVKLAQPMTALTLYEQSLVIYRELGDKRGIVGVLSGLACLAHVQGRLLTATRLLSAVETLLTQLRIRLDEPQFSDMERTIIAIRTTLDNDAFAAAWAVGRAMPLEQAITFALEGSDMNTVPAIATAASR